MRNDHFEVIGKVFVFICGFEVLVAVTQFGEYNVTLSQVRTQNLSFTINLLRHKF
jgi:hypothetical protein